VEEEQVRGFGGGENESEFVNVREGDIVGRGIKGHTH
jgi:hypothetical protein